MQLLLAIRDFPVNYPWPLLKFLARLSAIVVFGPVVAFLAMLPLSALLLVLPAFVPDESVLKDTVARGRFFLFRWLGRGGSLFVGLLCLAAVVGFALLATGTVSPELLDQLGERARDHAAALEKIAAEPSLDPAKIPEASPTYVMGVFDRAWLKQALLAGLLIYAIDLAILLVIGRVPLAYNVRNLVVRWRITLITAVAFTVIVALMTAMMAFVNGMYELTDGSGIPGNVIVMSDGSTDEVFSNLGYTDIGLIERAAVTLDRHDRPLEAPVRVARTTLPNGREEPLASRETYCIAGQAVPGDAGKRRFVQVRGIVDPETAGRVHQLQPKPGGRWFGDAGVDNRGRIEAVLGEGVAATLGGDVGLKTLAVGDEFSLGDRQWVIVGIFSSEGTTFGSEVWAKQALVGQLFSKATYTTVVLRADPPTAAAARDLAYDLRQRFTQIKLRAVQEQEYYSGLSAFNQQILVAVLVIAAVMALGGVFGVMNTMFAAIAQRTKDIGVLRLLGFKRWQLLVSFMLESLAIALIGGALGCALGSLCHGTTATSIVSSGQGGGGKTVILRLVVDLPTVLLGLLFTIAMGRLGGLVPALTAMRLKILESLR